MKLRNVLEGTAEIDSVNIRLYDGYVTISKPSPNMFAANAITFSANELKNVLPVLAEMLMEIENANQNVSA